MQDYPNEASIEDAFNHLFNSNTSLARLRDAALGNRLWTTEDTSLLGVPGQSLAWKIFLMPEDPLSPVPSIPFFLETLRQGRQNYVDRLLDKFKAPDGSYEEGFKLPGTDHSPRRSTKQVDLERNNPLSLDSTNPWTEWFASIDLRKTILQDVERTFPDVAFFRDAEVQTELTNILYLYSAENPSVGYRQGMHELLAPLYYGIHYDSLPDVLPEDTDTLREACSRTWVAADSWYLFQLVMRGVSRWYEWREVQSSNVSSSDTTPFSSPLNLNVNTGQVEMKPYVPPIVDTCNKIQSTLLRAADPVLWKSMQKAGTEPQIYGIRWLRLLFTREFPLSEAMGLWTGIFACDPSLEIVPWICVAMLIRIRNDLIPSDYSGQLAALLHYPSHQDVENSHTSLLLTQAVALQMSPSPSTGASLMLENKSRLGITTEVPEPPPPPARRVRLQPKQKPGMAPKSRDTNEKAHKPNASQQISQHLGIPESIARSLLDRGESLGINKTLISAYTELRRNIPDFSGVSRGPAGSSSTILMTNENKDDHNWEPRTADELEKELSTVKTTNVQLGLSLSWIMDVLIQDGESSADPARLQRQKREALESLSYIRDYLCRGGGAFIEKDQLFGEEQVEHRKQNARERDLGSLKPSLSPPRSIPTSDSSSRNFRRTVPGLSSPPTSPPPTSSLSPTFSHRAPWNHSPSDFSSSSNLPSTSLPRLPPFAHHSPQPTSPREVVNQSRTELKERRPTPIKDPLGAL